jgi:hypothetical protein
MIVELVVDGTSGDPELEEFLARTMQEYLELWKTKQNSYGPGNIAAFGDAGCAIRAMDKVQRLRRHYFLGKDVTLANETIEDTWLDLLGYAAMGLMCKRGQWKGLGQ